MKKWDSVLGVIAELMPETYLEIGILNCETLFNVEARVKVGVDVDPFPYGWYDARGRELFWQGLAFRQELDLLKGHHTVIYKSTSDDYFGRLLCTNTGLRYDVVFVDASHEYEQAMRDIDNALKILRHGGNVLVHDTNPLSELASTPNHEDFKKKMAELNRVDGVDNSWNGDVWKCLVELKERGMNYYSVDLLHGLAIVPFQCAKPKLSGERTKQIKSLDFKYFELDRFNILNTK